MAFLSVATNLVPGDTTTGSNGVDVFVRARPNGYHRTRERHDRRGPGGKRPGISSFHQCRWSFRDILLPQDRPRAGRHQHFRRRVPARPGVGCDHQDQRRRRGSQATGGESHQPTISPDGRFIVFTSRATNLVSGDSNTQEDIFIRDRTAGTTVRVNLSSTGAQATSGSSYNGSISADARFVAFRSLATNLIPNDTNSRSDIFLRDRTAGTTTRVSETFGGGHTLYDSYLTGISGDGRVVVFDSDADKIVVGDTNGWRDVFAREFGTLRNDRAGRFWGERSSQRMNNATWVKVHAANPLAISAGDLDGGGKDEAIASIHGKRALGALQQCGALEEAAQGCGASPHRGRRSRRERQG